MHTHVYICVCVCVHVCVKMFQSTFFFKNQAAPDY